MSWKRDPIADDQMVALALAKLAIERPGWLWTLRGLSEARGIAECFDAMHRLHKKDPTAPPAGGVTALPIGGTPEANREACFDYHLNEATHLVVGEFEWLKLPANDERTALLYEINDSLTAIMGRFK